MAPELDAPDRFGDLRPVSDRTGRFGETELGEQLTDSHRKVLKLPPYAFNSTGGKSKSSP